MQIQRQRQWQRHFENSPKEQSKRLVNIETLITFLTLENNNINILYHPPIKSDMGQNRNFCNVLRYSSDSKHNITIFKVPVPQHW